MRVLILQADEPEQSRTPLQCVKFTATAPQRASPAPGFGALQNRQKGALTDRVFIGLPGIGTYSCDTINFRPAFAS